MKRQLLLAVLILTFTFLPARAATITYLGGFEDTTRSMNGDFDYNDIVFSLSGANLALSSAGTLHAPTPALGTSGSPFWNSSSLDGSNYNIGYCMYGGTPGNQSNCGFNAFGSDTVPASGLAPAAYYLTGNSQTVTANDVTFTASSPVTLTIYAQITSATDRIGYYLDSNPGTIFYLTSGAIFTPTGSFGLVGDDNRGNIYHSETLLGNSTDLESHFAIFAPAPGPIDNGEAPEPSAFLLAGGSLALLGFIKRRAH